MKIYQDAVRPDLFSKLKGLDTREKLGFLQLQALVGMTKFDSVDKKGRPITLETDSHGIVRKTFQALSELGYLQNYEEKYVKDSLLIIEKLAFGNIGIGEKIQMYNMRFQKADKKIDFEDPEFRKRFPMVFSKRGILAKQGYEILQDENGVLTINYTPKKEKADKKIKRESTLRERIRVETSLEEQKDFVQKFMERSKQIRSEDKEKGR